MSRAQYDKLPPKNLNVIKVINRSHIPQNLAKTVEVTTTESESYNFGTGVGFGTETEIESPEARVFPYISDNITSEDLGL